MRGQRGELLTEESFQKRAKLLFLRTGGGAPLASGMDRAAEKPCNLIIVLTVATAEWLYDAKKSGYGLATVQESCGGQVPG